MSQLWWIEKNGLLVKYGRHISVTKGGNCIWESGAPELFYSREKAAEHCKEGEKPAKVRIVRKGEK